jgi:hypothetical protein
MKLAVAIQVHGRQMEDAEIARHPGGFADIDLEQAVGQPDSASGSRRFHARHAPQCGALNSTTATPEAAARLR